MRLRLRLILSFLIIGLIPFTFLIFQANVLFAHQLRAVKDDATWVLELIGRENFNQGDATKLFIDYQTHIGQVLTSIRYGVVVLASSLLIVIVGLSFWLAKRFAMPFEKITASAQHLSQLIQSTVDQENDLLSEYDEKLLTDLQSKELSIKQEESLISHVLEITASLIQEGIGRLKSGLKNQVDETTLLSSRMTDLEQFIHGVTEEFDVSRLLHDMTRRISLQLKTSFVGVYIMDESRQFVELKAAYSRVNDKREIIEHLENSLQDFDISTRFKVNEPEQIGEGLVGRAAISGEICQSVNLRASDQNLADKEDPDRPSEVAIPIRLRGINLGVIDVISKSMTSFTPEEIALLQIYADQVALVYENEKLLGAKPSNGERDAFEDLTRQAWDDLMKDRPEWGYLSDEKGIFKVEGEWHPSMLKAANQGKAVVWQDEEFSIASVPIRVRDYTLGVLDFRKAGTAAWTREELNLVQTLTDQLGQALENARLYQNTQMRAERERVLSDITSKVRASTNVDVILQTAIRELAEALRVPKGSIQLLNLGSDIREHRFPTHGGGQNDG
jgi:GAF domain-containing protein